MVQRSAAPDVLPLLSRGRHRSPRRGACFMELASYLAGERWSDHPRCTHPLLARLARGVNDVTSDDARPRLALLIPSVIGLTSPDPRWDHEVAVTVAAAALPVVAEEHQRALAVGVLTCERLLAADGRPVDDPIRARAREALAGVPLAARWAERFAAEHASVRHTGHPGPAVVDFAVQAVACTWRADADDILHDALRDAIDRCRRLAGIAGVDAAPTLDGAAWTAVCAPVRSA
ncbi:hypothetical protein [uncultured Cellulomonas sp.]|uniref:hypothetical protein n=1 Tax=uncultured Cellulomonas sp. TaxID=189682 RepID=UPI0026080FE0|nr:hypothetical protein [uncultured Cellulomonas sp.]